MTDEHNNSHKHGHECNHDHEHVHDEAGEMEWIELVDDQGEKHRFLIDDVLEINDHRYAVLLPEDQLEEDEPELVVFRIESDDQGQDVLVDIEDDDEFARVCEALDQDAEDDDEV